MSILIFSIQSLANLTVEQPSFELQHIYRTLEVIAKDSDFIQSELYKTVHIKLIKDMVTIFQGTGRTCAIEVHIKS